MKKRKGIKMLRICNKCGKLQKRSEELSNENWNAYDCRVKCECGGDFVTKWVEE